MKAEFRKQAAELLRKAASSIRKLEKQAIHGPVINLSKLEKLHGNRGNSSQTRG